MGAAEKRDENGSLKLELSSSDMGRPDSYRYVILSLVGKEEYDKASAKIREYTESMPDYPNFKARSGRFLEYALDLVNGIKVKRGFPGFASLPGAKQRDLFERAMDHFKDLVATLKKVEGVESEVRLEDLRSTIWVIQAVVWCSFAIAVVMFMKEVSKGVLPSVDIVITDAANRFTDWLFDLLKI